MYAINTPRRLKGGSFVTFILLLLVLAAAGIAVDYRMSMPGTSLVDRLDAKPVVLDMDRLSGSETQADVKNLYHHLDYTCTPETNPLGDEVCWAPVSEFNGIDARILAFFFDAGELSAVRVSFEAKQQPKVRAQMERRFGEARAFGKRTDAFGNNVVGWMRPAGFIATNDSLSGDEESLLLWLSTEKVLSGRPGR